MSALIARRTYSLLVTPSALAIFSKSRRNRFGKLIVSVSLISNNRSAATKCGKTCKAERRTVMEAPMQPDPRD